MNGGAWDTDSGNRAGERRFWDVGTNQSKERKMDDNKLFEPIEVSDYFICLAVKKNQVRICRFSADNLEDKVKRLGRIVPLTWVFLIGSDDERIVAAKEASLIRTIDEMIPEIDLGAQVYKVSAELFDVIDSEMKPKPPLSDKEWDELAQFGILMMVHFG